MKNENEAQFIFSEILKNNSWGSKESVSGSGSELQHARHLISELPYLLRELNVQSMLDIPCGDFNWMQHVDLGLIEYIGADIVPELIEINKERFENKFRRFEHLDIMTSALPKVDAVLCRDIFVHFPNNGIIASVNNIFRSGAKYLIATHFTFRSLPANQDIAMGEGRRVNFELAPFNWPPPRRWIVEGCSEQDGMFADKSLSVWSVSEIAGLLGITI
ncbi:class I SAM-dependent methyltransferase [Burkholderia stagnalis]